MSDVPDYGQGSREQCFGYRIGAQCTAWPNFRVSAGGDRVYWSCGHHLTRAVTAMDASKVTVGVLS